MPKRAHRVASRQAQLSKRRKKQRAQDLPTPRPESAPKVTEGIKTQAAAPATPAPTPARATAPKPAEASKPPARTASVAIPLDKQHGYVIAELRKIGILTAIIVAVLIALFFVLR